MKKFTDFTVIILAGIFFCFKLVSPVHATLIETDCNGSRVFGDCTLDTDTNLEWLDFDLSLDLTVHEVMEQFGIGGQFEGFTLAMTDELALYAENGGIDLVAPTDAQVFTFLSFAGFTFDDVGGQGAQVLTAGAPLTRWCADRVIFTPDGFENSAIVLLPESFVDPTVKGANLGSALYLNQVPEPRTLVLLGVGLVVFMIQKKWGNKV